MATHLVTGAAGFIGSHLAETLLLKGEKVIGVDQFNDYYDSTLKRKIGNRFLKILKSFIIKPPKLGLGLVGVIVFVTIQKGILMRLKFY
jgi:nucleoside-diphosphate-sugar epimerase